MIRTGKILTYVAIAGYTLLLLMVPAGLRDTLESSRIAFVAINLGAGVGAIAAFVSWGLALYHWGTRFTGEQSVKRKWGVALIAGVFVGGWVYWLTRPRETVQAA